MEQLEDYGFTRPVDSEQKEYARVTAVHRERFEIMCEHGSTYARLKSAVYFGVRESDVLFPTVGDDVEIQYNPSGDSLIVQTLERKSIFERKDPSSKLHLSAESDVVQAVVANFDYVFIVTSLNYDLNEGRIERYLTLAWKSGAMPVVVLTKADLVEDVTEARQRVERIAGFAPVHVISSFNGYGMEELNEYLAPKKTIVFLGSSGVGKSSLVNALTGQKTMKVNGIREDDSKGRHTTTYRQLIRLESGAMIIDTPGMCELGMWDVTEGIGNAFSDVEQYLGKCKFSNCTHENEPGCAIRKAIEDGELSLERYESYRKLQKEAACSDDKQAYHSRMRQVGKQYTKMKRQNKKY